MNNFPEIAVDRILLDEHGAPACFSYRNKDFRVYYEPLLWYDRISWWERASSLLSWSQREFEQPIWRVHAQSADHEQIYVDLRVASND